MPGIEHVQVGLCGWNGAQASYFQQFPCIEIQTTFYQPPALSVVEKWRAKAPNGFRFCLKAWQLITHPPSSPTYRRLREPIIEKQRPMLGSFKPTEPVFAAWERTREIALALNAPIVVLQCPKSFLPSDTNLRNLCTFLRTIPRDSLQLAWEPRGDAWTDDVVAEICQEYSLIHCVDPFHRTSAFGQPRYWRLHGIGSYNYRYTDCDLQHLKRQLLESMGSTFVMFNNFSSRPDALRFRSLLDSAQNR